ncbi:hypothetical protein HJFPF1_09100 [Paramyrothecium foliicola]|nr:hypothetical protein HJFPF1_09100 [Paramyrothecium foliicola]
MPGADRFGTPPNLEMVAPFRTKLLVSVIAGKATNFVIRGFHLCERQDGKYPMPRRHTSHSLNEVAGV